MSPPPGGSITSRLLKPLIKHLTRRGRLPPAPRPRARADARTSNDVLEETKQFARDVWRSTFGGLEGGGGGGTASRQAAWETIPLRRTGGRTLPNGRPWPGQQRDLHTQTSSSSSPLTRSTRFMATRFRPQFQPRGPGLVGHTGIQPSPVRTFATYGASYGAGEVLLNVPLGMRALADRLRKAGEDDDDGRQRVRLRAHRMRGKGKVMCALRRKLELGSSSGLGMTGSRSSSSSSSVLQAAERRKREEKMMRFAGEYKRFFAVPVAVEPEQVEQDEVEVEHQVVQEQGKENVAPARDPGKTTYLLLPLAPSLSYLLSLGTPTPTAHTHAQTHTESSSSYFHPHSPPPLLQSLFPHNHAQVQAHHHLLFPLLTGLSHHVTLGSEEPRWWKTSETVDVELILSASRGGIGMEPEPESMRLRFAGWTEVGVRGLVGMVLGETGVGEGVGEWFHVYEVGMSAPPRRSSGSLDSDHERTTTTPTTSSPPSLFSSTTSLSALSIDPSMCFSSTPSSYAPTVISDEDQDDHEGDEGMTGSLVDEEQTAWRMPILSESGGSVGSSSASASSSMVFVGDEPEEVEMDLGWVESRIWAE